MNRKHKLLLLGVSLALGMTATAAEVYRYTDANGNVHYTDRPTGQSTEQRVHIASRRTDPSAVQARTKAFAEATAARKEAAAEKPEEKTRAERRAEREEQEARCQSYRDKLATIENARRLYNTDENGERQYLDDAEIDEARAKARELVAENCG